MQFCKVADIADWHHQEFQDTEQLLHLTGRSRKSWEFIQVYVGLKTLGLLNGESRCLGLGVGHECLIFAFTHVCKEVIATDLYRQNWRPSAMTPSEVYEQSHFPYPRDRLIVHNMDMTKIEYPDHSFDFIWSCCSIEHVNNFKELFQVFAGIHRVLKPGGIAALTTEFNVSDRPLYEPNFLYMDQSWIQTWLTGENPLIQGFELLDQPDLTVHDLPDNQPLPRKEPKKMIQVITKDIINSSIAFFLRKTGEFSTAYHEEWLPPFWQTYHAACDAARLQDNQTAERLFTQLLHEAELAPRLKVRAARHLVSLLHDQDQRGDMAQICQDFLPELLQAEDEDQLLPLAGHFKQIGLWDEAHALFERVEQLPGLTLAQVVRCLIGRAEYLEHQNDYAQALMLLNQASELTRSKPGFETAVQRNVYLHQGLCHQHLKQFQEAIAAYEQAMSLAKPGSKFYQRCTLQMEECQTLEQQSRSLWGKVKGVLKRNP